MKPPMLHAKDDNGRSGNMVFPSDGLRTEERKLFNLSASAAKAAKWIIVTTVLACSVWFGLVSDVKAMKQDLAELRAAAQTKEAAKGERDVLGTKLDEMDRRYTENFNDIKEQLRQLRDRRR